MQNDWADPEMHIQRLDEMLNFLDKRLDNAKDDDETLKIIDKILEVTQLKYKFVDMMIENDTS